MNILFTNSGRRTYILDYALRISNITIHFSETDKYAPVTFYKNVKKHFTTKVNNNHKKYLSQILKIVIKEKIQKLIPLSDHDLLILSKNKELFLKKGCEIIISNFEDIERCINKKNMYNHCIKHKIKTPKSFFSKKEILKFSKNLIKKKITGSGGDQMEFLKKYSDIKKIDFDNFFVQNKISGTEYGVDIFSIEKKNMYRVCVKKKILMRAGETDRSMITIDRKIEDFCLKIKKYFKPYGNLDCDVIKDKKGKIYLIDLNPRFGGGYPASHESGFKFLNYLLKRNIKLPIKPTKKVVSKGISIFSKSSKK